MRTPYERDVTLARFCDVLDDGQIALAFGWSEDEVRSRRAELGVNAQCGYGPWTDSELARARILRAAGFPLAEVAASLGRSAGAVSSFLARKGVLR